MKKILLIKILYYLFFTIIILFAAIIFMEIMDFSFYDNHFAVFFRKMIAAFDF